MLVDNIIRKCCKCLYFALKRKFRNDLLLSGVACAQWELFGHSCRGFSITEGFLKWLSSAVESGLENEGIFKCRSSAARTAISDFLLWKLASHFLVDK